MAPLSLYAVDSEKGVSGSSTRLMGSQSPQAWQNAKSTCWGATVKFEVWGALNGFSLQGTMN